MPRPVKIVPHRITLRACKDLGWTVMAWCNGCGYGYQMGDAKLDASRLSDVPIVKLLEAGAIKCRSRCKGVPAHYLTISWMDVGMLRDLAAWRCETVSGRQVVKWAEPPEA